MHDACSADTYLVEIEVAALVDTSLFRATNVTDYALHAACCCCFDKTLLRLQVLVILGNPFRDAG